MHCYSGTLIFHHLKSFYCHDMVTLNTKTNKYTPSSDQLCVMLRDLFDLLTKVLEIFDCIISTCIPLVLLVSCTS